jgi:uncharacterized protein (TIGR00290 family)
MHEIALYWSGGKDCAMALHELRTHPRYSDYRVTTLLTTLTEGYDRISGHGVQRTVLEHQADCLGLDVHVAYIPQQSTMSIYEAVMENALSELMSKGITVAATGDMLIEKRRMATFRKLGLKGCFPLMQKCTGEQLTRFIELGFKAFVVCIDGKVMDGSFIGRTIDRAFADELPLAIDPCGEYGEFHTLVTGGPIFSKPMRFVLGETVFRESYYYQDVVLDN